MTETVLRPPLRVTLADEGELVTAGFTAMLAPYRHRVEVVPAADRIRPADLTLHDWPSRSALTDGLLERPRGSTGRPSFVVYTWNAQPGLVRLALARGARGCLSKTMSAASLVAALERIHEGAVLVEGGLGESGGVSEGNLTPREAEIITLITLGFDNYQVADQACLSINSVKSYVRSAYRKMGVTSRSQAVLWGVRHGYVSYPIIDWPIEEPLETGASMTPVA